MEFAFYHQSDKVHFNKPSVFILIHDTKAAIFNDNLIH